MKISLRFCFEFYQKSVPITSPNKALITSTDDFRSVVVHVCYLFRNENNNLEDNLTNNDLGWLTKSIYAYTSLFAQQEIPV